MKTPCKHENPRWTSPCQIYQVCDDCGAIRMRLANYLGKFDEWHTCKLCNVEVKNGMA
jgi:hypothetical protein